MIFVTYFLFFSHDIMHKIVALSRADLALALHVVNLPHWEWGLARCHIHSSRRYAVVSFIKCRLFLLNFGMMLTASTYWYLRVSTWLLQEPR